MFKGMMSMIDNDGNKLLSGELLDLLINKELYLECSRGKNILS